jgi:hypothetical protein
MNQQLYYGTRGIVKGEESVHYEPTLAKDPYYYPYYYCTYHYYYTT